MSSYTGLKWSGGSGWGFGLEGKSGWSLGRYKEKSEKIDFDDFPDQRIEGDRFILGYTAGVNLVPLNSVRDMDLEFGRVFLQYLPALLLKVLIRRWRGLYPIV